LIKKKVQLYDYQFQAKKVNFEQKKPFWIFSDSSFSYSFELLTQKKDTLLLKDQQGQLLVFVDFEKKYPHQKRFAKSLKNRVFAGEEKHIFSLIESLQAPNVEQRLRQLKEQFGQGDYLLTETLFILMGINPKSKPFERDDLQAQRQLISNIFRIYRNTDIFQIELQKMDNFEIRLPIYKQKDSNAKAVTELDLSIKTGAKVSFVDTTDALEINIDGVKVGKGWFKVGIPPLRIKGNTGQIFGFSFSLTR